MYDNYNDDDDDDEMVDNVQARMTKLGYSQGVIDSAQISAQVSTCFVALSFIIIWIANDVYVVLISDYVLT